MRSFARLMLGSLLCGWTASAVVSAQSSTRVEYHTPSGLYEAGCTRSFHAAVPAHGFAINVTVARENQGLPIISAQYPVGTSGASTFDYNYNSAYVPLFDQDGKRSDALLVRCQSLINESVPYAVGPSYLVLAQSKADGSWGELTQADIVFQPTLPTENYGTEDPRVVYMADTQEYFLFYSAVQTEPEHAPDVISRLALATTKDPRDISQWVKLGPIIENNASGPGYAWSKSGALLAETDSNPSLLIFGDSSIENGLQTARPSADFLSYTYNSTIFLELRSDSFDSLLVEAGPPPIVLSNGLVFFFYNSARLGYPSAKPGWDTQYNLGFLLLDPTNPTSVLFRSEIPILSPELGWEQGTEPFLGLTPNVVFVEGARLDDAPTSTSGKGAAADRIVFWYGAADSCVGMGSVTIEFQALDGQQTDVKVALE